MFKYVLDSSAEPKVIGVRDGGSQIVLSDKNQNDPNLKSFLFNDNKPWPDLKIDNLSKYEPELHFNIKKQARVTDFLSHTPYIHIVGVFSDRFVNILKKYNLHDNITFKEVFVFQENVKIQEKYFIIQQPNLDKEINWEKTCFYDSFEREINNNEACLRFKDENHYIDTISLIDISKISFRDNEVDNYDFVSALSEHFVSDRLAEAIVEANFTNIVLKNLDSINCSEIILHE
jgi:hypothetical protein